MTATETAVENFKRATALAIKAIGHKAELEVGFTTEPSGVAGSRVRVPLPSAGLPRAEIDYVRGAADAVALRLRHHDPKLYNKQVPSNAVARAAFEALEQARCEALGAREMPGVAANLATLLEERCKQQGFSRADAKAEIPIAEAMRVLAFEALAQHALPKAARRAADVWRVWVEERIGPHLGRLPELLHDQKAYAAEVTRLLKELDMGAPGEDRPEDGEAEDIKNAGVEEQMPPEDTAESESQQGAPEEGTGQTAAEEEGIADEKDGQPTMGGDQDAENPHQGRNENAWESEDGPRTTYRIFTTRFDETVVAKDLCPPEELSRDHPAPAGG